MKILSIGNSFSVDSQRWVGEIAKSDGIDIELGNLYIGGCSLETHVNNIKSGQPAYEYYVNNRLLGCASVKTGLLDCNWDIITLQQASHFSGEESTYYPYLFQLAEYVHSLVPNAAIYINQTWAYEYNSTHGAFVRYNNDRREMHKRLTDSYINAAKAIGAGFIPVGNAVHNARELQQFDPERGGTQLSRDGFHLGWKLGRYLASAVWYETFTGRDIRNNSFIPMDIEYSGKDKNGCPCFKPIPSSAPDIELLSLAKEVCHETVAAAKLLDINPQK